MKLLFTDNPPKNNQFILRGESYHHLIRVLRFKRNDSISIIWQNTFYHTEIKEIKPEYCLAVILSAEKIIRPGKQLSLLISVIKEDKIKLVIEKLSEIGISTLYFYPSAYSQKYILTENKKIKFYNIAKSACEQSGNPIIPSLIFLNTISDLDFSRFDLKIGFFEILKNSEKYSLKSLADKNFNELKSQKENPGNIIYTIGPEGGYDKDEIDFFLDRGFLSFNLGPTILRSETAAISAGFFLKTFLI